MATRTESFNVGHPAPHRGRIRVGMLMLGLLAAPLAWALQLLMLYGFASEFCGAQTGPPPWMQTLPAVINVAGLVAACAALALSFSHLRATRDEHEERHGGLMDAGEGRTRFLAIWGIWLGVVFLLAIAFNTISVFWGGLCGG